MRGAVKPISTLARPLPSADLLSGATVEKAHYERSDISVVPAAGIVGEAMVLLTLARFVLEKTGGDSMAEITETMARWRERLARPVEPTGVAALAAAMAATSAEAGADGGTAGSGGDD